VRPVSQKHAVALELTLCTIHKDSRSQEDGPINLIIKALADLVVGRGCLGTIDASTLPKQQISEPQEEIEGPPPMENLLNNRIILLGGILSREFQNDLCTAGVAAQEIGDLDWNQT
jgi:hypothetical protein